MSKRLYGLMFVGGAVLAGLNWSFWPKSTSGLLPYLDTAVTAQGRDIYDGYCASCHGANLQGQPDWRGQDADGYLLAPPHNQTGHTWHHVDDLLFRITKEGSEAVIGGNYRSRMAGFGDILSDDEIIAVLAYIKSTWPSDVIEQHNTLNANAEILN